jgi:hypothetical protein
MPFEIPKYFNAETRSMIEAALDEAWQEARALKLRRQKEIG